MERSVLVALTPEEERELIGFMAQISVEVDSLAPKSKKKPEKFELGKKAATRILLRRPVPKKQLQGLIDVIGGYFCAVTDHDDSTEESIEYAHELMALAEKIEAQVKLKVMPRARRLKLVRH